MSDNFDDDEWKCLFRQYPLVAKKIETLRCETISYDEFSDLRERVEKLENLKSTEIVARPIRKQLKKELMNQTVGILRTDYPEVPPVVRQVKRLE